MGSTTCNISKNRVPTAGQVAVSLIDCAVGSHVVVCVDFCNLAFHGLHINNSRAAATHVAPSKHA